MQKFILLAFVILAITHCSVSSGIPSLYLYLLYFCVSMLFLEY